MLHTKCRRNRFTGPGEEIFLRVSTIHGHGGHLGHVSRIMTIDYNFFVPESLHTKFGSKWSSGF